MRSSRSKQPREESLRWLDLSAICSGHSVCEFGNAILGKIEGRRLPQDDYDLGTVRQAASSSTRPSRTGVKARATPNRE